MSKCKTLEEYQQIAKYIDNLVKGKQVDSVIELGNHLVSAGFIKTIKKPSIYSFISSLKKKGIIESNFIRETGEYSLYVNPKWLGDIKNISESIKDENKVRKIKEEKIESLEELVQKIKDITLDKNVISLLDIHIPKFLNYKELYESKKEQLEKLNSILETELDNVNLQINGNKLELNQIKLKTLFDISSSLK